MMEKRIEYIDSIRGLAIFLVVMGHAIAWNYGDWQQICVFSPSQPKSYWVGGVVWQVIYSFHMALFFMVSGFLSGVSLVSRENIFRKIWKKTERLFIPYIVTTGLVLVAGSNHVYWFLLSLFEISLVGFLLLMLLRIFWSGNEPNIYVDLFVFGFMYLLLRVSTLSSCFSFIDAGVVKYFIPFTFGMLMRRHKWIERVVAGKHTFSFCFLIYMLLFASRYLPDCPQLYIWIFKIDFYFSVFSLLACILVFNIFMNGINPRLLGVLSYLGKISLPIYILHILFVVRLPVVGHWMLNQPMMTAVTLQVVYCAILSGIAIVLCVLSYKLLCRSWIIKKLVFGES